MDAPGAPARGHTDPQAPSQNLSPVRTLRPKTGAVHVQRAATAAGPQQWPCGHCGHSNPPAGWRCARCRTPRRSGFGSELTAAAVAVAAAASTDPPEVALADGELLVPQDLPPEDIVFVSAQSGSTLHFSVDPFGGGLQYAVDDKARPPFRRLLWQGTHMFFPDIGRCAYPPLDEDLPRILGGLQSLAIAGGAEYTIPKVVRLPTSPVSRTDAFSSALHASLSRLLGSPRAVRHRRKSDPAEPAGSTSASGRQSPGSDPECEDAALLGSDAATAVRRRVTEWLASIPIGGRAETTSARHYDAEPLVVFALRRGLQDEAADIIYAHFVDARTTAALAEAEAEEEERRRALAHLEEVPSAWTRALDVRLRDLRAKHEADQPLSTREETEWIALEAGYQRYIDQGLRAMEKQTKSPGSPLLRARQALRALREDRRASAESQPAGMDRAMEMRLYALRAAAAEDQLDDEGKSELAALEEKYEVFINDGLRAMDRIHSPAPRSPGVSDPPSPSSGTVGGVGEAMRQRFLRAAALLKSDSSHQDDLEEDSGDRAAAASEKPPRPTMKQRAAALLHRGDAALRAERTSARRRPQPQRRARPATSPRGR
eukprot:TRINITY_DN20829_c0_g1_i1.p1 TRINITY_DN20829_c0_g1~~TRINITY_DN20829_c0_g1_i1.p1  ORF type:complete len:601 (+),score=167.97 TRINITY_DN20829_c0_g1_i1:75-1877(+)